MSIVISTGLLNRGSGVGLSDSGDSQRLNEHAYELLFGPANEHAEYDPERRRVDELLISNPNVFPPLCPAPPVTAAAWRRWGLAFLLLLSAAGLVVYATPALPPEVLLLASISHLAGALDDVLSYPLFRLCADPRHQRGIAGLAGYRPVQEHQNDHHCDKPNFDAPCGHRRGVQEGEPCHGGVAPGAPDRGGLNPPLSEDRLVTPPIAQGVRQAASVVSDLMGPTWKIW